MVDNSELILRWEIDNVKAVIARKKAESKVFNEGGFNWTISMDNNADPSLGKADIILRCSVDHNGPWKCEVEAGLYLISANGNSYSYFDERRFCFDENNRIWKHERFDSWIGLNHRLIKLNGKSIPEFRIKIMSSERDQPIDSSFIDVLNRRSNVILKFGENKLHVSKEYLAIHSPFFDTLFFGDFSENGKEEVEINDVIYEEFLDLLQLIYVKRKKITDRTVAHILKLSDQFQFESILELAKEHLAESKGIDTMKKLLLADKYGLHSIRDQCLQSFTTAAQLTEKIKSSEYEDFSDRMKVAICDRIRKI